MVTELIWDASLTKAPILLRMDLFRLKSAFATLKLYSIRNRKRLFKCATSIFRIFLRRGGGEGRKSENKETIQN